MTQNDKRSIGSHGLEAAPLGLGCMGMSEFYGTADEGEAVRTIHRALELGVTLLDTADMYGPFTNEKLVGRAVREWGGERPLIATKFGNVRGENGEFLGIRGDAGYVRNACEASLQRLGLDTIDLYYQHRVDPEVPIEETVGAMAELVQEGKVRHLGLSEAGAETIRRAVEVHPISALQTEYSLWERSVEEEILPTIRELGIGFVAYSPLGRGFLTGKIRSVDDLEENDARRVRFPRFERANLEANLALVEQVEAVAQRHDATPGQVALAWVLSRGDDVIAIPGTKRVERVEENLGALDARAHPRGPRRARRPRRRGGRRPLRAGGHADGRPVGRVASGVPTRRGRPSPAASAPGRARPRRSAPRAPRARCDPGARAPPRSRRSGVRVKKATSLSRSALRDDRANPSPSSTVARSSSPRRRTGAPVASAAA